MNRPWILAIILGLVACAHHAKVNTAQATKRPRPAAPEAPGDDKYRVTPTPDTADPSRVYVPMDLEDAFRELDKMLTREFRDEFKSGSEDEAGGHHFGLGLWMRNNWGLWAGSRLAVSLRKLGLRHPDDMSGLIITAYWRRLNGKDLGIEAEVRRASAYWDSAAEPNDKHCPEHHTEMSAKMQLVDQAPDGQITLRHVGRCDRGDIWIYSVGKGWAKPSESDLRRIRGKQGSTIQELDR